MELINRKEEILNLCLNIFIKKGLSKTSTRDISSAMKLQSGGMYYYFNSKDDIVIASAEKATLRIESALMEIAISEIDNPTVMMEQLQQKAVELAPTMKFFVSVCADKRYEELIKPVLHRMGERYLKYSEKISKILDCRLEEIMPYVNMYIIAVTNYMIFGEKSFVIPQMKAVLLKIEKITDSCAKNQNC